MTDTNASPYLSGFFAPVPDEIEAFDLEVTGSLPAELVGRYFRNGPNPLPGTDPSHWFLGDGMIHGIRLNAGRAEWYRNRWVRTKAKEGERHWQEDGSRDFSVGVSNTSLVRHAGRIFALVESSWPCELTPELETVGPWDFGGKLTTAMTAHPKEDPATGELHFFGYCVFPPFVTYHKLSAAGELVRSEPIDVLAPTMMHDFTITENHVVWLDLPMVFDLELVTKNPLPYRWSDDYPARIGIMPKDGGGKDVRWIEVDPAYVFHIGNAREDADGQVILEAVRHNSWAMRSTWSKIGGISTVHEAIVESPLSNLYRWVLDPAKGTVSERQIDDRMVEFPTINDTVTGRPHQYVYAVTEPISGSSNGTIVKYDTVNGATEVHDLGDGVQPGEAEFVPAADANAEDDGWLLSIVSDKAGNGSELLVLDATDVSGKTVASVRLPRRVPMGFHGTWIPDSAL